MSKTERLKQLRIAYTTSRAEQPHALPWHTITAARSSGELLALVLQAAVPHAEAVRDADRLLQEFGGLAGLARAIGGQDGAKGLAQPAARRLAAALELGRRMLLEPALAPRQVHSPRDIGPQLVAEMAD